MGLAGSRGVSWENANTSALAHRSTPLSPTGDWMSVTVHTARL